MHGNHSPALSGERKERKLQPRGSAALSALSSRRCNVVALLLRADIDNIKHPTLICLFSTPASSCTWGCWGLPEPLPAIMQVKAGPHPAQVAFTGPHNHRQAPLHTPAVSFMVSNSPLHACFWIERETTQTLGETVINCVSTPYRQAPRLTEQEAPSCCEVAARH